MPLSELIDQVPGFWPFCIAALALILSAVALVLRIWIRAGVDRERVRKKYAAVMFDLDTARRRMLIESRDRRRLERQLGTKPPEKRSLAAPPDLPPIPPRRKRDRRRLGGKQ